ncbi:MAG: single-stranded DNA-binding protein [Elusimicrobiaceae bacterium]|nr:single-stranded DNA-binding protein [Elusimicrobiaceae bacterium]
MRLVELNNVIISGRITQEPKIAITSTGKMVLSCNVAVNKRYMDKITGEWKDDVVFVPVVVWGDAAQRAKDRLSKGSPVVVTGKITSSSYTDKNGQNRTKLQVTADRMQMLESAPVSTGENEAADVDDVPF